MFNLGYFKGQPTEYIVRYRSGRVVGEGAGLAFYYWKHNTQIVSVPTSSIDVGFVFNEITNNFQEVTIQGQLTYRVLDPKVAASQLNFTLDPARRAYVSDDPDKLAGRIRNIVQIETRNEIQKRSLEETLRDAQAIVAQILPRLKASDVLKHTGVELVSVYFLSTRPTPEVGKALEAEYREKLMRQADEAVYARRAAAVDEEGKIKEKELERDKTLEVGRKALLLLQGENARQEAESRGQALEVEARYKTQADEARLALYRALDPRLVVALGLKDLGQDAGRVGNLTITTELLASILASK